VSLFDTLEKCFGTDVFDLGSFRSHVLNFSRVLKFSTP
jgi:hypothetical protein